ncbi:glutaredoxin family protein [Actimicrobium sp. CCC2.4]|uniref:glutaredoxin family protein n=1 Tax=Actimicrobium sp. CCC2.4 TaxID=3048606 RepID=UPI002AC89C1E|nr:glutaredoxin family protein [Actimicrobium sp. CCC2.4]MEB0135826.1 glutaredoxin family protein [Actimicrobium sp. CCC2.4]WPX33305.1 glutaredoxin family protein [Actimicrobium sp. CCC2.4]
MHHLQKILTVALMAGAFASSGALAQQMYKWTGADGKINYTDTPPPATARRSESQGAPVAATDATALPYELARAAKNFPVVLYTMKACVPCDSGRVYLSRRGIPFTEKTVTSAADTDRMKQAGGDGTMPMLLVGRSKQTGFESGAWDAMLTVAAYPANSQLPSGYRNPPASAAAPVTDKGQAEAVDVINPPSRRPLPSTPAGKPDSGFRF